MSRLTVIFCAACVVLSFAFAVQASSGVRRTELGHVQVRSLVLVDDEGKKRAMLSLDEDGGACFDLLGGKSGRLISLCAPLRDDGHTVLVLRDGRGGKATLTVTEKYGALTVQGDTRGSATLTSHPDKPAAVELCGQGWPPDVSFHVDRECRVLLVTKDDDGKVTNHIPTEPPSKEK